MTVDAVALFYIKFISKEVAVDAAKKVAGKIVRINNPTQVGVDK